MGFLIRYAQDQERRRRQRAAEAAYWEEMAQWRFMRSSIANQDDLVTVDELEAQRMKVIRMQRDIIERFGKALALPE